MKINRLNPADLAQFAVNLIIVLSGGELSAIDPNVRQSLLAAFGTEPELLAVQDAEAEAQKAKKNAAFAARNATAKTVRKAVRATRDSLKAAGASKKQFELCGFDYVDTSSRSSYIAQLPTGLAVKGFSNGAITGKFKGNNKSGSVLYEIWRRDGKQADWALCMAVRPPNFIDEGVTPGQYCEYRVRAKASKNVSLFSNTASIYSNVKPKV